MKKFILIFLIGLFLFSCEKDEEPKIYSNLGDMLKNIDDECAYQIYLEDSVDLINWCGFGEIVFPLKGITLNKYCVGLHEINHYINAKKSGAKNIEIHQNPNRITFSTLDEDYRYTCFSFGEYFYTEFNDCNIEKMNIISQIFPENLKSSIYDQYIVERNNFTLILDELNSNITEDLFYAKYVKLYPDLTGEQNIGQTVNFMLYLQFYLKTTRIYYPDTYNIIKSNIKLINLIQRLWSNCEFLLDFGYEYIPFKSQLIRAIYSDGTKESKYNDPLNEYNLLSELDSLGIQHKDRNYWKEKYLNSL